MGSGDVRREDTFGFVTATTRPASPYVIWVRYELGAGIEVVVVPEILDCLLAALTHQGPFRLPAVLALMSTPLHSIPPVLWCTEGGVNLFQHKFFISQTVSSVTGPLVNV